MTSCGAISITSSGDEGAKQTCSNFKRLSDCVMEHIDLCDNKILTEAFRMFIALVNRTTGKTCRLKQEEFPQEIEGNDFSL
ncbi:hypothetical protein RRG08_045812 [Elysia crispata]|uniref:Uncharacterized protein n=1 Tax=Elysia crispata TaxID=231223 RepID=A0AAE1D6V7_9GAST|nr:hypothetical protein RRG08_045812 [Elysia crispata]